MKTPTFQILVAGLLVVLVILGYQFSQNGRYQLAGNNTMYLLDSRDGTVFRINEKVNKDSTWRWKRVVQMKE